MGVELLIWRDFVEWMKVVKFGVIFFGMGFIMMCGKYVNSEGILVLICDFN